VATVGQVERLILTWASHFQAEG